MSLSRTIGGYGTSKQQLTVATSPCPAPTDDDAFWKEIRGYKNYMLIGSELGNHGVQIFDMTRVSSV